MAVINSDEEILQTLELIIQADGYSTAAVKLHELQERGVEGYIEKVKPKVIVWDINDPVDENIRQLDRFKRSKIAEGKGLLVVTPFTDEVGIFSKRVGMPVMNLDELFKRSFSETMKEYLGAGGKE